jgi:ABC-type bacteriocin/lantibiotic exporter with double-glycine peptidase domain
VKLRPTEDDLGTNEIDGTLPGAITEYLYRENVLPHATFTGTAIEDVPKPCLVLYRWYRDDHYSVVTRCTKKRVWLFNPGNGKVESLKLQDFEDRWWTKRPSSRTWALTLERYGK